MRTFDTRLARLEDESRRSILTREGERLDAWLGSLELDAMKAFIRAIRKCEQPDSFTIEERHVWEDFTAGPGYAAVWAMLTACRGYTCDLHAVIATIAGRHAIR